MPARRLPASPPVGVETLLNWPELRRRITLSRSTVFRLEREGHFPRSVKLSPGRVAWRESEVLAWIAKRQQNTGSYVAD